MLKKWIPLVVVFLVLTASGPVAGLSEPPSYSVKGEELTEVSSNSNIIEINYTYHLTPSDPGSIQVDANFSFPDSITNFSISLPNESQVISNNGFTEASNEYDYISVPDGNTSTPSISYRVEANVKSSFSDDNYYSYDAGDWAIVKFKHYNVQFYYWYQDENPKWKYSHNVAKEGVAGSSIGYLGSAEAQNQRINGHNVNLLIPDDAQVNSENVFETINFASNNLEVGSRASPIHIFVGKDPVWLGYYSQFYTSGIRGKYYPIDAVVREDQPIQSGPDNTWLQEYVHTLQIYNATEEMEWIDEGMANYYERFFSYHLGYADFAKFHDSISPEDYSDANLTKQSSWESPDVEYDKGTRVIAGLEVEIRDRTNSKRSLEDVFDLMNEEEEPITYDQFAEILETVTGEDMRPWLEKYVKGDEVPEIPHTQAKFELSPSGTIENPNSSETLTTTTKPTTTVTTMSPTTTETMTIQPTTRTTTTVTTTTSTTTHDQVTKVPSTTKTEANVKTTETSAPGLSFGSGLIALLGGLILWRDY